MTLTRSLRATRWAFLPDRSYPFHSRICNICDRSLVARLTVDPATRVTGRLAAVWLPAVSAELDGDVCRLLEGDFDAVDGADATVLFYFDPVLTGEQQPGREFAPGIGRLQVDGGDVIPHTHKRFRHRRTVGHTDDTPVDTTRWFVLTQRFIASYYRQSSSSSTTASP